MQLTWCSRCFSRISRTVRLETSLEKNRSRVRRMTKQCTQTQTASQLKQLVFIFNKKKTTPGKNILYGHNSPTSAAKNCILWKGEKKRREGKRKRGTNAVTLVVGCPFFFPASPFLCAQVHLYTVAATRQGKSRREKRSRRLRMRPFRCFVCPCVPFARRRSSRERCRFTLLDALKTLHAHNLSESPPLCRE